MKTLQALTLISEIYFIHLVSRLLGEPKFIRKLWWRYRTGKVITVPWPVGEVEVGPNSRNWNGCISEPRQLVYSSDPNDHYRPWLEANVGKQQWDWDWNMCFSLDPTLTIVFRKGREELAVQASLMWA